MPSSKSRNASSRRPGKGHPRRRAPPKRLAINNTPAIKQTALRIGGQPTGTWDKVFFLMDDMKVHEIKAPEAIVNPQCNSYVFTGRTEERQFAELIPEIFAGQFPGLDLSNEK